jgi:hypothetical protein
MHRIGHDHGTVVLGELEIVRRGCFRSVRRYLAGWHPHLGRLHYGWSGQETIVERDLVSPVRLFVVGEREEEAARAS